MFRQMGAFGFTLFDFQNWLISFGAVLFPPVNLVWDFAKPDIIYGFGDTDESDRIKRVMYHELAHASQYQILGRDWWKDYVQYIVNIPSTGQPEPYGDGTLPGAGRAEVTEGMAESIGLYMADLQFGLEHSNPGNDPQRFRNSNLAERLTFWTDAQPGVDPNLDFIPEGLFFDLFDENGQEPATVSEPEPIGIIDPALGFSFEQQMEALSTRPINIGQYRETLFDQFGQASGTTEADYLILFNSYGQ